jgi:hypothetical protein
MTRKKEKKIVSVRNSSRIYGLTLTIVGVIPILVALANAWMSGVSFLNLSVLYEFLWINRFTLGLGIEFELFYLVIAGAVTSFLGVFLLARRTQRIEEMTVIAEDLTVTVECTNCSDRWKEDFSKKQLQSLGFPQNRRIARRRCPTCGKFTRPRITTI